MSALPLAEIFADERMAQLVREKVTAQGFYLDDATAIALLHEMGVATAPERVALVKLGFELGCCARARAEALRLLPSAGRG